MDGGIAALNPSPFKEQITGGREHVEERLKCTFLILVCSVCKQAVLDIRSIQTPSSPPSGDGTVQPHHILLLVIQLSS